MESHETRPERWFETAIEYVFDGVVVFDASGKILYANSSFARLVGQQDAQALTGTDGLALMPDNSLEAGRRDLQSGSIGDKLHLGVHDLKRAVGGTIPVEVIAAPLAIGDGLSRAFVFVVRDITERKQSEDKLRFLSSMVEQATEGIAAADLDGKLLYVNDAWCKMHDYENPKELLGKSLSIFHNTEQMEAEVRPFNAKVKALCSSSGEVGHIKKDGTPFPTMMVTTLLKNEQGIPFALSAIAKDITELKNAQLATAKSDEKYRALFEGINDAVFVHPLMKEGFSNFIEVNEIACSRLGYTREELLNLSPKDISSPEDGRLRGKESSRQDLAKTKWQIFEAVHIAKSGKRIPVEISSRIFDLLGQTVIMSLARDITERRHAERMLRIQRDLGVALHAAAGLKDVVRLCHDAAIEISGMDCGGVYLVDERTGDLHLFYHKGLGDSFIRAVSHYRADSPNAGLVMQGEPIYQEYEKLETSKNDVLMQEKLRTIGIIPIKHEGQVIACLHLASHQKSDFPELSKSGLEGLTFLMGESIARKRVEEALLESGRFLQNVFDAIQDGVSVLNPDLEVVQINKWMKEHYSHGGQLIGRKCYEVYQQRETPCPFCPTITTLETGRKHTSTVPYPSEEDPVGWLELTAFPLPGPTGTIEGVIEYIKDITEQKRLEAQLRQMEKMDAIGQLAGGIAHDFNNQLTAIVGCADLLRNDPGFGRDVALLADNILAASQRASGLTGQLLAFSRLGKYHSTPVNVHMLIAEVATLLGRSIDKRIVIKQHLNASPPITVGDATQLQNAILNLALNARDAMPDGGELIFASEVVELDAEYCKIHINEIEPGEYLQIAVTDSGVGMDKQVQAKIFEPFFTTKEPGRGTGMGLSAVYGTVKNHKGGIGVYSEPGKGSTFRLYLPLSTGVEATERPPINDFVIKGGPAHILLVDDEDLVCETANRMLERLGYQVTVCSSGAEAVELYRKNRRSYDLVILDMIMPGMSGRETFNALKEINPDIVALLCSGFSLNGEAKNVLENGIAGFIQKPFNLRTLSHLLSEHLDREE